MNKEFRKALAANAFTDAQQSNREQRQTIAALSLSMARTLEMMAEAALVNAKSESESAEYRRRS